MEELARQAGWAKTFGLPLELVSADEAQRLFPPMSTEGVLGAAYLPTDGYIDPSQLTLRARRGGPAPRRGDLHEHARHRRSTSRAAASRGVETDKGPIEAEVVVNAGGMFAGEIGALAGVNVPIVPMAHEYLITKPSGVPLDVPTMRDPSLLVYFRGESGGLVMGGYERHPAPWGLDGIPPDFNGKLLAEDWERFEELHDERRRARARARGGRGRQARQRPRGVHARRRVHPRRDRRARLLGRGRLLRARARRRGRDGAARRRVDRRGRRRASTSGRWTRAASAATTRAGSTRSRARVEVYSTYYDVKYPGHERQAGRPLRLSPTYARLQELGAAFGEKSGWERANWFEPNAERGDESLRPRGWAGRLWSPAIGAEHRACREAAALFDETSFAKIEVLGPGAAEFLERLCDNRVARDVGAVTYTQMLNPRGGIECDFTVTRLAEDRFRIVTGTAFGQHDLAWIRSHAPETAPSPSRT